MARDFDELRNRMSPERREQNRQRAAALLVEMDLAELRGHRELTQEDMADRLQISQSNISRLERRSDMLVSTLREVIEALGGELHLVAEFPEGSFEIKRFDEDEAA
jgi:transcriptional regulator with XRE-family HTH domain